MSTHTLQVQGQAQLQRGLKNYLPEPTPACCGGVPDAQLSGSFVSNEQTILLWGIHPRLQLVTPLPFACLHDPNHGKETLLSQESVPNAFYHGSQGDSMSWGYISPIISCVSPKTPGFSMCMLAVIFENA